MSRVAICVVKDAWTIHAVSPLTGADMGSAVVSPSLTVAKLLDALGQ